MKRIRAACLIQTVAFTPKDGFGYSSELAKDLVRKEYETYKAMMDRNGTQYKILREETRSDGSIIVELKKQNNNQPIGDYFA